MVDFYGINVSEYTSSMDTMGHGKNNQGMYVRPWKEAEIAPNWKFHLPTIDFQALLLEGTQKTNDFHPQKSEVCLVFTLPETNS